MSDIAIRVEGLSKQYHIGARQERYRTFRDTVAGVFSRRSAPKRSGKKETVWALKDVSFEVQRGEVLGIIGRNGAGKSTLLKILSRITEPSTGYADIYGRVGSLLEVGTGFHPELTGRENIYLNGAILGMSRTDISRKFDEILDFSEIEKFIDTPVKHYSSGMYLRLAFAVAAHLEPEILLVDEVLAVGDARFQNKCLGKMASVATEGRTVIFVSHSMAAVSSLCRSALLIDGGCVRASGNARQIIEQYLSQSVCSSANVDLRTFTGRQGSGETRIVAAQIARADGTPSTAYSCGDDMYFSINIEPISGTPRVLCCIEVRTALGTPVLHLVSSDDENSEPFLVTRPTVVQCVLRNVPLYPGTYLVSIWTGPSVHRTADYVSDALKFHVDQGHLHKRGFDMSWNKGVCFWPTEWVAHAQRACYNEPTIA